MPAKRACEPQNPPKLPDWPLACRARGCLYHGRPCGTPGRRDLIALIQRVSEASVTVDGTVAGAIGRGVLAFVAVQPGDGPGSVARLAERVATYRVFPDDAGRMNRSLADCGYGLLAVPQFTLAADTKKGTRASFTRAAAPDVAAALFDDFVAACRDRLQDVQTGVFGADMRVALVNDGPVTFWLEA